MSGLRKVQLSRGQNQVKKRNVILPNNASLHYHHVVRGFGEGFGVKFDCDVHFIIRVHILVYQQDLVKKKIGKYKNKIKFGAPTARHFCGGKWGRLTTQNKLRVS